MNSVIHLNGHVCLQAAMQFWVLSTVSNRLMMCLILGSTSLVSPTRGYSDPVHVRNSLQSEVEISVELAVQV